MAFSADTINRRRTKVRLDARLGKEVDPLESSPIVKKEARMHPAEQYSAIETYNYLLEAEIGKSKHTTEQEILKEEQMKDFLRTHFGTDKVQNVDITELKEKLEGPSLINRIGYRRSTGFLQ